MYWRNDNKSGNIRAKPEGFPRGREKQPTGRARPEHGEHQMRQQLNNIILLKT
jgi:hypothetical protein